MTNSISRSANRGFVDSAEHCGYSSISRDELVFTISKRYCTTSVAWGVAAKSNDLYGFTRSILLNSRCIQSRAINNGILRNHECFIGTWLVILTTSRGQNLHVVAASSHNSTGARSRVIGF